MSIGDSVGLGIQENLSVYSFALDTVETRIIGNSPRFDNFCG